MIKFALNDVVYTIKSLRVSWFYRILNGFKIEKGQLFFIFQKTLHIFFRRIKIDVLDFIKQKTFKIFFRNPKIFFLRLFNGGVQKNKIRFYFFPKIPNKIIKIPSFRIFSKEKRMKFSRI